jgi:hypothetical protein
VNTHYWDHPLLDLGAAPELDLDVLTPSERAGLLELRDVVTLGENHHLPDCSYLRSGQGTPARLPLANLAWHVYTCCAPAVNADPAAALANFLAAAVTAHRAPAPVSPTWLGSFWDEGLMSSDVPAPMAPQLEELFRDVDTRNDEWVHAHGACALERIIEGYDVNGSWPDLDDVVLEPGHACTPLGLESSTRFVVRAGSLWGWSALVNQLAADRLLEELLTHVGTWGQDWGILPASFLPLLKVRASPSFEFELTWVEVKDLGADPRLLETLSALLSGSTTDLDDVVASARELC